MGFVMKRILSACLLVLSCGSALGADMLRRGPQIIAGPTPLSGEPVSTWSGFYVGANAGGAIGDVTTTALSEIVDRRLVESRRTMGRSGPIGGLQVGFALQSGAIVYGLEADLGFGALRGGLDTRSQDGLVTGRLESKLSMLGTVRGRVGLAFDNLLFYGTGGFANAYHEGKAVATTAGGVTTKGALTEWVPGWTLGLGGEMALARNTSVKLEYLHATLTNKVLGQSVTHSLNLLRAGVNYRF